ncbi:MAG: hypothetical protein NZ551_03700 [Microscillaceae bacterium]|nr:hypothetical protein [Microscillaceae bacterium]MDW8460293.1 hypothetical protein [Cytophagales bacterium]
MFRKFVVAALALLVSANISFATGGKDEKETKKTQKNSKCTQADLQIMATLSIEAITFDEIPVRVEHVTIEQKLLNMLRIENIDLTPPTYTPAEQWLMNSLKITPINLGKVVNETYKPLFVNEESSLFDIEIE